MINVQPYIDKIEMLKVYMGLMIDGYDRLFLIDVDGLPYFTPESILRMFNETGMMFYSATKPIPKARQITFDE